MAMPAAASTAAVAARRCVTAAGVGGGENGKFFGQLGRTTMRAGCAFPMAGADKDFTVMLALLAMKFINWHGNRITGVAKSSSVKRARKYTRCRRRGDETHF